MIPYVRKRPLVGSASRFLYDIVLGNIVIDTRLSVPNDDDVKWIVQQSTTF